MRNAIYTVICFIIVVFNQSYGSDIETLGEIIFEDTNLSLFNNQSCSTCHAKDFGFADPMNTTDPYNSVVSVGSDTSLNGSRNAPTVTYASFSPVFHHDGEKYIGGLFWDGRATGERLGLPLAEQAQGPPLNPVEMALPNMEEVVYRISVSTYRELFIQVFPGADFSDAQEAYDNMGLAVAAYQSSKKVNKFSSRFDKFWNKCQEFGIDVSKIDCETDLCSLPKYILTKRELKGLALFNDPSKGNCAACHTMPIFSDFTFDNLGIPKSDNPLIENNPPDLGLGGRPDINDVNEYGKFIVPTLRNVALTPPYGHNGYFASLSSIVHFYNTRDILPWEPPEVAQNVNTTELGNLGLTYCEEKAITAFLLTLTDK